MCYYYLTSHTGISHHPLGASQAFGATLRRPRPLLLRPQRVPHPVQLLQKQLLRADASVLRLLQRLRRPGLPPPRILGVVM